MGNCYICIYITYAYVSFQRRGKSKTIYTGEVGLLVFRSGGREAEYEMGLEHSLQIVKNTLNRWELKVN